ncbi:hypothetical protein [Endozoicomonas elysicola]|nr:hypothetical protein [Endozoicomonas elysicola]
MSILSLDKSSLWSVVKATSNQAIAAGSVNKEDGEIHLHKDHQLPFYFKVVTGLANKPHCENLDLAVYKTIDPFIQANADILVGYLGTHHQILLSRFNVVEYHLVIATREFEQQGQPLSQADLAAMWLLLSQQRGLAIYNGGVNAGCSQQHKHMQFIPTTDFKHILIDGLINQQKSYLTPLHIKQLPFQHLIVQLTGQESIEKIENIYHSMLNKLELYGKNSQDVSHNTLLSNQWLLIVPRSAAIFSDVHINAFAIAGLFFLKNTEVMENMISAGPINILRSITKPT